MYTCETQQSTKNYDNIFSEKKILKHALKYTSNM